MSVLSIVAVACAVWILAILVLLAVLRMAARGDIALNQAARTWPSSEPDRRQSERRRGAPDAERPRWVRQPVEDRRSGSDRRSVSGS